MSAPPKNNADCSDLKGMTDTQILDLVARAKADPFVAQQVFHLQKQAFSAVSKVMQGVVRELTDAEVKSKSSPMQATTITALASEARSRAAWSKQKQEIAQNIAIGAFMNRDNPNWNPLDAASHNPTESGVLALLQFAVWHI